MFAKAIVGWARYNGRTKISISKQESKKNFAVYRIYITSTNVGASAVSAGENGADSPNLRPQGPALPVERSDKLAVEAVGTEVARATGGC